MPVHPKKWSQRPPERREHRKAGISWPYEDLPDYDQKIIRDFIRAEDLIDSVEEIDDISYGFPHLEINEPQYVITIESGDRTWVIFSDYERAHFLAVRYAYDQIADDPFVYFDKERMVHYLDLDQVKNDHYHDFEEMVRDNLESEINDIQEDETLDESEKESEINDLVEEKTEEFLNEVFDPNSSMLEQYFPPSQWRGYMHLHSIAEDAIDEYGFEHILPSYDGEAVTLPFDAVYVRLS